MVRYMSLSIYAITIKNPHFGHKKTTTNLIIRSSFFNSVHLNSI